MLRVGVIGAGGIAQNIHLPSLAEMQDVKLAAICDLDEQRAREAAAHFNVEHIYRFAGDMLGKEQLDAVFVLVWPEQSYRLVADCITAGIPVFTEKPAGITLYQSQSLLRLAEENHVAVEVGFNRRFIPLLTHVLELFRSTSAITQVGGTFFKHSTPAFYGGCASAYICDVIHVMDTIRFIAGSEMQSGAMAAGCYGGSQEENAWNAVFRFENGITGVMQSNYCTGGRVHEFEIHGPAASAYLNLGFGGSCCEADILFHQGSGTHSLSAAGAQLPQEMHLDGKEIAKSEAYHHYYGYYDEDRHFLDCVRSKTMPDCDLRQAVLSMQALDFLERHPI
jgi:virulence factor